MSTSRISSSAKIGSDTNIGEFCLIGDNVRVGKGCVVGHRVVIHGDTVIGDNVRIDDGTVIGKLPMTAFLRTRIRSRSGDVTDPNGKVIGHHDGLDSVTGAKAVLPKIVRVFTDFGRTKDAFPRLDDIVAVRCVATRPCSE